MIKLTQETLTSLPEGTPIKVKSGNPLAEEYQNFDLLYYHQKPIILRHHPRTIGGYSIKKLNDIGDSPKMEVWVEEKHYIE